MIPFVLQYLLVIGGTFFMSLVLTPLVILLAKKIGAVDMPSARRINTVPMPTAGGLAIFIAFSLTSLVFLPMIVNHTMPGGDTYIQYALPLIGISSLVGLTGLIDDIKELTPLSKLGGIVLAASLIWFFTDFRLTEFKIPLGGPVLSFPDWLSFMLTVIWIVSITNAVNLIDGLDGLVSGVSIISLVTMGIVSYFFLYDSNIYLTLLVFVLVAAIAGFLPYNFYPAVIYLGDTGALLIGFLIAVMSLQGLKNAAFVAVITPVIILAVPIIDTFVAIIRRKLSGQKIYEADKMHLHHRLLSFGLSHRTTVLVIYAISFAFAMVSIILNVSNRLGGVLLLIGLLVIIEVSCELLGVYGTGKGPFLKLVRLMRSSEKE